MPIDQLKFELDPKFQIIIGLMTAVMVFSVGLDLRVDHFREQLKRPKAIIVGVIGQYGMVPALGYLIARYWVDTPSVALGLILITAVPGGSMSNFMTSLARGNIATSVSLTGVTTLMCVVVTPLVFGFWASLHPATAKLLSQVGIDPKKLILMFTITLAIPIIGGMVLLARRPATAARIRPWLRGISLALALFVVIFGTATNYKLLAAVFGEAVAPVTTCCVVAILLGWIVTRAVGLPAGDRRALTIEMGGQNPGVAIGMSLVFFPTLAGSAITAVVWGVIQPFPILALVAVWNRMPIRDSKAPA